MDKEEAKLYWKENIKIIISLLIVWFVVSFGFSILLVDVLNNIEISGVKLGFWFGQQGSIYVFVVLIFIYVYLIDKLDKKYGLGE